MDEWYHADFVLGFCGSSAKHQQGFVPSELLRLLFWGFVNYLLAIEEKDQMNSKLILWMWGQKEQSD